jgi:hypothetical protein
MMEGFWSKVPESWIDWIVEHASYKRSPILKPWIRFMTWSCGMPGEKWSEILQVGTKKSVGYTVLDHIHQVTCPALLLVGEKEGDEWVRQAKIFYDGISSQEKEFHLFKLEDDGSNDHCQLDNRSRGEQVMFDWFDDLLDYRGS